VIARHRARNPALAADDPALLDELAPLFDDRDEALRSIAPWVSRPSRSWSREDFARAEDREDTSVRDLVIAFGAALESRWGLPPLRAHMACESVHEMVSRGFAGRDGRSEGPPAPPPNDVADARRGADLP
jgi:hypothetical protein